MGKYKLTNRNIFLRPNGGLITGILLLVFLIPIGCEETEKKSPSKKAENKRAEEGPATQLVEMDNDYGLTTRIQGNRSYRRTWVEPSVEKIATLSEDDEYTLFNPQLAFRLSNTEHIYVLDPGDHTVKAFTQSGKYVATYGKGQGRGPGQIMMVSDVGVWRDSLIYLVDPRQRRISFFKNNGDFLRSNSYESPLARLVWAQDSTEYAATPPSSPSYLRIKTPSGSQATLSAPFSKEIQPIMLDGWLHPLQNRVVHVARYFPVLLTFSPEDTTGVAHPTPDYGRPRPKAKVEKQGRVVRAPSTHFHGNSALHNGLLSIRIFPPGDDGPAFDVYDANELEYKYSIRLPVEREDALYIPGAEVAASIHKATVNLYEVQSTEEQPVDE